MPQLIIGFLLAFICFKFWGNVQPVIVDSLQYVIDFIRSID